MTRLAELRALLTKQAPLLPIAAGEYDGETEQHEILGARGSNGYPREVPLIGGFFTRMSRDLAVAAVNALPALLDVAEAAEQFRDEPCACHAATDGMCPSCALREALSRMVPNVHGGEK